MEFVDHTGHIFSLPSYQIEPTGYEYNVNPYVFWIDDEYTFKLSINNYYIKPIRFLIDKTDFDFKINTNTDINEEDIPFTNILITVDSNVYKLIGSRQIQDMLSKEGNISNYFEIKEEDLKSVLKYSTTSDNPKDNENNDLFIIDGITEIAYYTIIKKYKVKANKIKQTEYSYIDSTTNKKVVLRDNEVEELLKKDKDYIVKHVISNTSSINIKCTKTEITNDTAVQQNTYIITENTGKKYILTYNYAGKTYMVTNNSDIRLAYYFKVNDKYYLLTENIIYNTTYSYIDYYTYKEKILSKEQEAEIDKSSNTINIKYNKIYKGNIFRDKNNQVYGYEDNIDHEIEDINTLVDYNDLILLNPVYHDYVLCTFYVIGNAEVQGTWNTNVMIVVYNNTANTLYCPITVGGTFDNECEELIINGYNFGIRLPKDIVRALYNTSFYDYYPNDTLYNEKLKELLLNYMNIKGECGNFKSAINSLKWFGWNDKISISKLLETDNQFITQYILNKFDINTDIISAYKYFKGTALIDLKVNHNTETGYNYNINFDNELLGEGKPILKDLFNEIEEVYYDELDITFYKKYYDFVFQELGLKLACLTNYYTKYFLPIHLKIHDASISYKVYTNDIKFTNTCSTVITEQPVLLEDTSINVSFPDTHTLYIENSEHYIDENYNEFNNSNELGKTSLATIYYFNEACVCIPIKFSCNTNAEDEYYNCAMIIERNSDIIYEKQFAFTQNKNDNNTLYKNLVLLPKLINKNFDINYWINGNVFNIYLCVNGKWFNYYFNCNIPEMRISLGKLKYKYFPNDETIIEGFSQLSEYNKFKAFMYQPDLVKIHDIRFNNKLLNNKITLDNLLDEYKESINIINNDKYLNRVHICDIYDNTMQKLKYSIDDDLDELYSIFFNTNGQAKPVLKLSDKFEYDFYLMHDTKTWYCVFISKATISELIFYKKELNFNYESIVLSDENNKNYTIKYVKSDNRFLINRMDIEWTNGINHFNTDDIIVASVSNPDRLAFNYDIGSKWIIKPKSLRMTEESKVNSNTNIAMFSIGKSNTEYSKGYYDITVNYCVDNYIQHTQTKTCIFRVN